MLTNIIGVMKLNFMGEKPFTLSVGGYEVTLPNGDCIHFDWNDMEGNSLRGTNTIELILSNFDVEIDKDLSYSTGFELVEKIVSGEITELYMEAFDENGEDATPRVKVSEFYIEYESNQYHLINKENIIKKLIDIFWANIVNREVITETHKISMLNTWVPESLQCHFQSISTYQSNVNDYSPFLIIEPYGESLEKLDPEYFSERRSLFYQEV